jgi:hypothetical protein
MDPPLYPAITPKVDSSSDNDGKTKKITIMKLRCNNWTEWKKYFKNLLVGRGHEEIFDTQWCIKHANDKVFRKKSALAFTLLHSYLSSNLKPVATAAKTFVGIQGLMYFIEANNKASRSNNWKNKKNRKD